VAVAMVAYIGNGVSVHSGGSGGNIGSSSRVVVMVAYVCSNNGVVCDGVGCSCSECVVIVGIVGSDSSFGSYIIVGVDGSKSSNGSDGSNGVYVSMVLDGI
jgi:hypothetical protein